MSQQEDSKRTLMRWEINFLAEKLWIAYTEKITGEKTQVDAFDLLDIEERLVWYEVACAATRFIEDGQ
jgi:hypothetical protein